MSYSIMVKVTDGTAVTDLSGDVPDGTYVVSGHEDERQRTLGVTRQGTDGRYAEAASHTHYKEA